jgi:hypothetical protein
MGDHVALTQEKRNAYRDFTVKPGVNDHLRKLGVVGGKVLKWVLKE